jgi:lipopolysaccharide transport system permease protein
MVQHSSAPLTRITIRPTQGWAALNLHELYAYRDLIAFLVWRDVKVRYRQTVLGALWAMIQPLMTMIIMAFVFGRLAGMPSDGVPYPVFCFAGLVLWNLFSQAVTSASASVVNSSQLVEKVYFPRLVITFAASLAPLLDFCINFALLIPIMIEYGCYPRVESIFCLPLVLGTLILAIGIGSGFAALTVRFRDFRHVLPFLVQLWLFATPVIYPLSLLPEKWRSFAGINPLAGLIECFRWALLGTESFPYQILSISFFSITISVLAGLVIFRRMERDFADVI